MGDKGSVKCHHILWDSHREPFTFSERQETGENGVLLSEFSERGRLTFRPGGKAWQNKERTELNIGKTCTKKKSCEYWKNLVETG